MGKRIAYLTVTLLVVLISTEAILVRADDSNNNNGNSSGSEGNVGNNGNNNGNGNTGDNNGNNNGNGQGGNNDNQGDNNNNQGDNSNEDSNEGYRMLTPLESGQERAFCEEKGECYYKTLTCPTQCPERKPKKNKKDKGCHINVKKCEATCKWRKPNCNGYGSLCYDPRFVGGDGVMFYFHGSKGGNFAILSDDNLHINAHFIGTRPQGRTRDFTWVQALSIMFDLHNLVIAAKKVSKWEDKFDALTLKWDGEDVIIPNDEESEWSVKSEGRKVSVERTDDTNSVRVTVYGLLELDIKVKPIGKEENRVHRYQLPEDDSFAHLETQFKFKNLSDQVEGVLGKTYRPDYVSPVKIGVPMPMMGGEDKYQTPSLFSPQCLVCRFKGQSGFASTE